MLKKVLSVLLCAVMVCSLAACSSSTKNSSVLQNNAIYNENGYFKNIKATDYFDVCDLSNVEISQSEIDEQIQKILNSYPDSVQVTDRAVADKDTVNIDYVGYFGDEAFDGGSTNGKGTNVVIGSTQYIDDFIDQLIEHKPGETFDVMVTFPEEYEPNPAYAGKDAKFVVTINYIQEFVDATWNDAFVEKNFKDSLLISTTAEAEEIIKGDLAFNKIYMDSKSLQDVPEMLVNWQLDKMVEYYTAVAASYGVTLDDYLKAIQIESVDKLREQNKQACLNTAKQYLFMQAVAEKLGYVPTEEDENAYFDFLQQTDPDFTKDSYLEVYGSNYVRAIVMYDYLEKHILDHVDLTVVEKPAE